MSSLGSYVLEQSELFTVQILPLNSGMSSVIDGMEALLSTIGSFRRRLKGSPNSTRVKNRVSKSMGCRAVIGIYFLVCSFFGPSASFLLSRRISLFRLTFINEIDLFSWLGGILHFKAFSLPRIKEDVSEVLFRF